MSVSCLQYSVLSVMNKHLLLSHYKYHWKIYQPPPLLSYAYFSAVVVMNDTTTIWVAMVALENRRALPTLIKDVFVNALGQMETLSFQTLRSFKTFSLLASLGYQLRLFDTKIANHRSLS